MKKLAFLSVLVFIVTACNAQPSRLNPQEFEKAMKQAGVQIIDIRTAGEYNSGHIAGAKNIDFYKVSFLAEMKKLDLKKPVLIYCASGNRSGQALGVLKNESFVSLSDLQGGIRAWSQAGKSLK